MALDNKQIVEKLMYESREMLIHLCDSYTQVSDAKLDSLLATIIGDNLRSAKQLRMIKSRNQ